MLNFKSNANGYVRPRKVTSQNLENLFAALLHLIQLSGDAYSGQLTGILGVIFNRILYMFNLDPKLCIANLKLVKKWWIEYLRGGLVLNPDLSKEQILPWNDEHNCPELVVGLPELYDKWLETYGWQGVEFASRVIFCLLSVDRIIVLPVSHDHSNITNGYTGVKAPLTYDEVQFALNYLGMTSEAFMEVYNREVQNFQWEILNSKGPNGESTWTAHLDARAWASNPGLFKKFVSFAEVSRFNEVLKHLVSCIRVAEAEVLPNLNPKLGKLAYIEEWGGKSRIVAQLDYWSQMLMTPLHNTINHFLKRIPQDGTFNQDAVALTVKQWSTSTTHEIYSYDLTAATDRLPITIQEAIISRLFSSHPIAAAWTHILRGRKYVTSNGDEIQYAVGQPMGARSSFPMLALTHHVLIIVAAQRAGVTGYTDYVVLGDDSTMLNSLVSAQYLKIMESLGMAINMSKSIVHRDDGRRAGELCKRVFVDGIEISAINPKLIVETINDGRLGPDLQNDLTRRGFHMSSEAFWTFMAAILDKDNLRLLLKLNIVPKSISGLTKVIPIKTPISDYGAWLPGCSVVARDLTELMTFVVASEGLKRLDAILRMATSIMDVLRILAASNRDPKVIPANVRDVWISEILTDAQKADMEKILASVGTITYSHPIVLAATAETNRISEYLHALNSLDTVMVERAREGLLDMFRSSVGAIWLHGKPPIEQVSRAVFTKMMTTLVSIWTRWNNTGRKEGGLAITYSVVLTSISRLWNIHFALGGTTTVNALRSSVTRGVRLASSHLSEAIGALAIVPSGDTNMDPKLEKGTIVVPDPANSNTNSQNSPVVQGNTSPLEEI